MASSITPTVKKERVNDISGDYDRRDALTDCSNDTVEMIRSLRATESKARDNLTDILGIVAEAQQLQAETMKVVLDQVWLYTQAERSLETTASSRGEEKRDDKDVDREHLPSV